MASSKVVDEMYSTKRIARKRMYVDIFLTFHELLRSGKTIMEASHQIRDEFHISLPTIYEIRLTMPRVIEDPEKGSVEYVKTLVDQFPEFKERFNAYELTKEQPKEDRLKKYYY